MQVRDNYLVAIDNIQQADPEVVLESQMTMNTTTRYDDCTLQIVWELQQYLIFLHLIC